MDSLRKPSRLRRKGQARARPAPAFFRDTRRRNPSGHQPLKPQPCETRKIVNKFSRFSPLKTNNPIPFYEKNCTLLLVGIPVGSSRMVSAYRLRSIALEPDRLFRQQRHLYRHGNRHAHPDLSLADKYRREYLDGPHRWDGRLRSSL